MSIMTNDELFFVVVFGGFVLSWMSALVLWHILHLILCPKYDEILFRKPYFRENELVVFSSWPLSLFRSMGYILLLATPKLAKRKRFKGVELGFSENHFLVFLCRLLLLLALIGILSILVMIISVVISA